MSDPLCPTDNLPENVSYQSPGIFRIVNHSLSTLIIGLIFTLVGFGAPAILWAIGANRFEDYLLYSLFFLYSLSSMAFGGFGLYTFYSSKWSHVTIDFNNGQISYAQAPFWYVYCASKKFVSVGDIRWGTEDSGWKSKGQQKAATKNSKRGIPGTPLYNITMSTNNETVIVNSGVKGFTEAQHVMNLYSVWFNSNLR